MGLVPVAWLTQRNVLGSLSRLVDFFMRVQSRQHLHGWKIHPPFKFIIPRRNSRDTRFLMRFFPVCRPQSMIRSLLSSVLLCQGLVTGRWSVFAIGQAFHAVFEASVDVPRWLPSSQIPMDRFLNRTTRIQEVSPSDGKRSGPLAKPLGSRRANPGRSG